MGTSGRTDDNAEAIKKRLVTYHLQSQPVITAMEPRGIVQKIDAANTPDEVFADVEKALAGFRKQQLVLVLGPPLSGKTSLCKGLARTGMFSHVASADLLRAETMSGSVAGKKIAEAVRSGKPVPPEIIAGLVKKAVAEAEHGKILIDGFPRTMAEAQMLTEAVASPSCVLYLDVASEDGAEAVMMARNAADPPLGDAEEATAKLKTRLEKFEADTSAVVDQYRSQGLLKTLEAAHKDEEGAYLHAIHGAKRVFEQAQTIFGF